LKREQALSTICLAAAAVFVLSGCSGAGRYTYDRIRAEAAAEKSAGRWEGCPDSPMGKAPAAGPFSIAGAVDVAIENNPDMEMAEARIGQSEAMIQEARAAFLPVLTAYGEYTQADAPSAYLFKTIDARQLPAHIDFNAPGWFENYEIGLQARINLFHGGRDLLRKHIAATGLTIQKLDRKSLENVLTASVIRTYYNCLAAEDFIRIAEGSVSTVQAQLQAARVRYEAGGALRSDVLSLDVRLAQAKEDMVRARNSHSLSLAALANLLGVDPECPLELSGPRNLTMELPEDYPSALALALERRPDLQGVRYRIVQSRMNVDAARAEHLPRLDAQGRIYADDPQGGFETDGKNWTAGVVLTWDLFSGGGTRARVVQSKKVLEEMLAADAKTVQAVRLEVKTACLALAEARARLEVSEASVAQAEESLRLVKRQYEGGSATVTRYLDAELARNLARIRSTAAFYDREKAVADLGRALGYWAAPYRGTQVKKE